MSGNKITQKYINDVARKIDVKHNKNGKLDGDEISIFEKELAKDGITNPQMYVNSFNNSTKSVSADIITKEIDDAFAIWGWTWLDDLDKAIEKINSGNVLEVLESYDNGDSLIEELDSEVSQTYLTKYGNTIINSLLEVAKERNIDVSDIVTKNENNGYVVGPSVKDANSKELATDSDNLDLVVTALRKRIESYTALVTDKNSAKDDPKNAMLAIAYQVDSKGNGDGTINGDEVAEFKAACSKVGIIINDIISSIFKKSKSEEKLTENEEFVKNIFSGSYAQISYTATTLSNQAEGITKAIRAKDEDELRKYISSETVTADNVENILSSLDKNEDYSKLTDGCQATLTGSSTAGGAIYAYTPTSSGNKNIAKKLVYAFGDDAKEFNEVILKALCDKAAQNDIDISDIVKISNDKFFTPEGEYALDSKYVNKVIESVRSRINEKLDK